MDVTLYHFKNYPLATKQKIRNSTALSPTASTPPRFTPPKISQNQTDLTNDSIESFTPTPPNDNGEQLTQNSQDNSKNDKNDLGADEELDKLHNQLKQIFSSKVKRYQEHINQLNNEVSRLKNELTSVQKENAGLLHENHLLEEELSTVKSTLNSTNQRVSNLQEIIKRQTTQSIQQHDRLEILRQENERYKEKEKERKERRKRQNSSLKIDEYKDSQETSQSSQNVESIPSQNEIDDQVDNEYDEDIAPPPNYTNNNISMEQLNTNSYHWTDAQVVENNEVESAKSTNISHHSGEDNNSIHSLPRVKQEPIEPTNDVKLEEDLDVTQLEPTNRNIIVNDNFVIDNTENNNNDEVDSLDVENPSPVPSQELAPDISNNIQSSEPDKLTKEKQSKKQKKREKKKRKSSKKKRKHKKSKGKKHDHKKDDETTTHKKKRKSKSKKRKREMESKQKDDQNNNNNTQEGEQTPPKKRRRITESKTVLSTPAPPTQSHTKDKFPVRHATHRTTHIRKSIIDSM